jgi:hypothetical protein
MTNHYHHHQHNFGLVRAVVWGTCILAAGWLIAGLIALIAYHPWLLALSLLIIPVAVYRSERRAHARSKHLL